MHRARITLLTALCLGLSGCVIPQPHPAPSSTAPAPTTSTVAAPGPTMKQLEEIAAMVERETGARIGIATSTVTAGSVHTGAAWSTAKVPVAIAALRRNPAAAESNMWLAITASNNAAAESLWESLGTPIAAAYATDEVLRAGGDNYTHTQSQILRPGYSAFGQTEWRLMDQAGFAEGLAKLEGSAEVLRAMGNINADQRYGLGTIPGAIFKGGWGPGVESGYVVRQFGLMPGKQPYGIAIMAVADDYNGGQYALSLVAKQLLSLS